MHSPAPPALPPLYPDLSPQHNAICALTLETVVPFDKMQISWTLFFFFFFPRSTHPPFPRLHTVGRHSWGAERSPSSLCRHGLGCCGGTRQPSRDAGDASARRKCRGKLNFSHNSVRNCRLMNAAVASQLLREM